ncbi:hypothetical protein Tco_0286304 [Tanacetum coccineum]
MILHLPQCLHQKLHLLCKSLWNSQKSKIGGNVAFKEDEKNLRKQQFEHLPFGSREVLDSAYEMMKSYVPFFCSTIILCPQLMKMKDLLQLMKNAMEEIDIRWQVAMENSKDKEVYEKTEDPIDLKPKNGDYL